MHTKFAVYTEDLENDSDIIVQLFSRCSDLGDSVIITDSINSSKFQHYPLFPSFYLKFFPGSVIFMNIEDYLQYKDNMMGSPMLFMDENTPNSIDKSLIKNEHILNRKAL